MTLGEIIKIYRDERSMSQRQFAEACGLSNGYISMLEKNLNPKTGLPMVPSLTAIKKIAALMGVAANDILDQMDDVPVEITSDEDIISEAPTIIDSGRMSEFMELFEQLPEEKKARIIREMKEILTEE